MSLTRGAAAPTFILRAAVNPLAAPRVRPAVEVPEEGPPARPGDSWWSFRPGYLPFDPQKRTRFLERLLDALRTGAGLGAAPRLRWETGPRARMLLGAPGPVTRVWVARVLLPCYPPGEWQPAAAPAASGPLNAGPLFARPRLRGAAPYRSCRDASPSWGDGVASTLSALPSGATLDWRLDPPRGLARAPPVPAAPPVEAVSLLPGSRLAPLPSIERLLRDRAAEAERSPRWAVRGVVRGAARPPRDRLASLVAEASQNAGGNGVGFVPPIPLLRRSPTAIPLSEPEVAGLFPSPWARLPGVPRDDEATVPTLAVGVPLGEGPASLPFPPDEGRHLLITGESGMGKSTSLVGLAVQASRLGGVVMLDPIGDSARRFLSALPPSMVRRVLWVSPLDSPVGVNVVAGTSADPVAAERRIGDLVAALRRVREGRYPDRSFWGPRVEETVTLALSAASLLPSGTLEDALAMLEGMGRGAGRVPPEARAGVERLRERVREHPEEVDGGRRLLAEVVRNPFLRRMLCYRSPRLKVRDLFGADRITIISGDAPRSGETAARGLLALLLALLAGELLAREAPAPKVVLALDELQWYAHESVGELVRLGRRANVHLWAATQSLATLAEPIREALLTNAADLLAFRGSSVEARELARLAPGVEPDLLASLPRGSAAFLRGKGSEVGYVRLPALPPSDRTVEALGEALERSRPFWADAPAEGPGGAEASEPRPAPAEGPPGPAAPGDGDPVRRVLLVLWAGLLGSGTTGVLRVRLDDLRAEVDPEGRGVRAAGSILRRAGALVERERAGPSGEWELRRGGFATLLGGGVGPEELRVASEGWARVAARRALRGAGQAF